MFSSNRVPLLIALALSASTALAGCAMPRGEELELKLGTLMPLTGALANLGPDMQRGAKLAIADVNGADAGIHITAYHEDDKTTDTAAIGNTFNLLVSKDVTAIAGPCCSGITDAILRLAIENEVVISTPSATSPMLTEGRDNEGFFWRVPPSDALQGRVLAKLVDEENVSSVNLIIINNPYGNGLANVFTATFEQLGGEVGQTLKYLEGDAANAASQVVAACDGEAEGLVLVAYTDDAAAIVKEMQAKGCLGDVQVFGSEGFYSSEFPVKAGEDDQGNHLAAGIHGTTPQAAENVRTFAERFEVEYDHAPEQYAAESYDAVMYVALAALAAGSTDGADIAEHLLDVANDGEKVSDFAEAAELIAEGEDIDWVGQAHDFDFGDDHEPTDGLYSYWRVNDDGTVEIYEENVAA